MSEGRGRGWRKANRTMRTFLKMSFLSLRCAPGDRICYGIITEVIFEPTSVHLICLALRGGQISVVDEGQGKKVSLVLFLSCAIFLHTHVSVQPQQRDTSLANIFP